MLAFDFAHGVCDTMLIGSKLFHALPPHPKFCHTIQDATNPLTAYFQPYMDMTHASRHRIMHLNSDPHPSIHFHKQPPHFAIPDFHALKSPFRNLHGNIVDSSSAEAVHFLPQQRAPLSATAARTAGGPDRFRSQNSFPTHDSHAGRVD
jgi:hypothetical protein